MPWAEFNFGILRRLSERPELRACAKVVAILQPSRRRGSVVGVLREDPFGKALMLMPCDPRMPMCLIRSSELTAEMKASLKVAQCFSDAMHANTRSP